VRRVLWRLTPAALAALDDFEGVESGFYRKDFAKVEDRARRRAISSGSSKCVGSWGFRRSTWPGSRRRECRRVLT
jgi:hypothetical protein